MMKKSKEASVVLDERCVVGTTADRRTGRDEEATMAPSTSMIFMDAVSNINVQDFSIENVREYTLQKFNVDVTKNIFDTQKPTTRAEIRAEQRRINASKQTKVDSAPKDSVEAKRKFEPTFGSSDGGMKKKNVVQKEIFPDSLEVEKSFNVQKEAYENARNLDNGRKMAKTVKEKQNSKKKVKKNIISSKMVKSKNQVESSKQKSGRREKIIPVSLESPELQHVRKEVGENAENPQNETKQVKAVNSKAKTSKKKLKVKKA